MYFTMPTCFKHSEIKRATLRFTKEENLMKHMDLKGGELIWINNLASPMYRNMYAKFDRYINDEICFVMIGKGKKIGINIELINRLPERMSQLRDDFDITYEVTDNG